MHRTTVVVIGAGQAGLAASHQLTARSIDHVVLERGETAEAWRRERWDSLRLLTPNWMTRLPGAHYDGPDPDGYMSAAEVREFLDRYARSIAAPIHTGVTVQAVRSVDGGVEVDTTAGQWRARSVVVATGACGTPRVPAIASELPGHIHQLPATAYRNPSSIPDGRVVVVGASASGAQIADELARHGRDVTVCVGDHVRLPRSYRQMDIHWWMDTVGILDEGIADVEDIRRARRLPSLQLVGSPERRDLGLNELAAAGVQLTGRLVGVRGSTALCSGSFANLCSSADLKLHRLLDRLDEYATEHGLDAELPPTGRPAPTSVPDAPTELDLTGVGTVVWATGFRPRYPWLEDGVLDRKGAIVHDGGVMERPGMYVLGLPFLRRRKSSFLDGVGDDAAHVVGHLAGHLDSLAAPAR